MPHGYQKYTDTSSKCKYRKTHKNGEETEIDLEKIPEDNRWFGYIKDEGQTKELGRFDSKSDAKRVAKNWMRENPKGLNNNFGGGGFLPGLDGAQNSNDFFG